MEMSASVLAIAIPAVMFAGVSKGGFGSGAAFAASSILALVLSPGDALGIMLPLLMLMDITAVGNYRGDWVWHDARRLILGGVPGIVLGAMLWEATSEDTIRLLIGLIAVLFVVWQIWRRRAVAEAAAVAGPGGKWRAAAGLAAGVVAGFTSFVSHAGGPPAALYLLSGGLRKTQYQATTVLVFWVINAVKVLPYAFLGIFSAHTLASDLVPAPFAVLGTWLGVKAHHRVPEVAFFALTYVLLTLTGLRLIWIALT